MLSPLKSMCASQHDALSWSLINFHLKLIFTHDLWWWGVEIVFFGCRNIRQEVFRLPLNNEFLGHPLLKQAYPGGVLWSFFCREICLSASRCLPSPGPHLSVFPGVLILRLTPSQTLRASWFLIISQASSYSSISGWRSDLSIFQFNFVINDFYVVFMAFLDICS